MTHATATVDLMRPPFPAEPGSGVYSNKLGMWVFLASDVMFFTALIGTYILLRFGASAPGARLHAGRLSRGVPPGRARGQRSGQVRRRDGGLVRLDVLHDDGLPWLPRDLRRHLDDLPVPDQGPAGQILAAGLPGHRDDRVVLALRRSGLDHPVHDRLPDLRPPMETTEHKLPNYMLIWLYLFILTGAEVLFAFEMPISQLVKILCLMVLAVVKALLVALFFMHLKFERWRLRVVFMIPLPLAA